MQISDHLIYLYGEVEGKRTYQKLVKRLQPYRSLPRRKSPPIGPGAAILITYGDQVQSDKISPLRSLAEFCRTHLPGVVSGIHILPFFPYSSDDGFAVIDYRKVNPALGDWEDLATLGEHFDLMFDAVVNHISAKSAWFQAFLKDEDPYRGYFIVVDEGQDLSQVVRPRDLPLLTRFETPSGSKSVWTTFSSDQIDLNYHDPNLLIEMVDCLMFYVSKGASLIRLDAIAYLWKEVGTACIHLPQTHQIVQLLHAVLEEYAPDVLIITETNVPHEENLSYFGDGTNEAQMVYNFALPPLILHTFHSGNATALTKWASGLKMPSKRVTFFNFLASHDGIGVTPARGLISDAEFEALVKKALEYGGLVSYRRNPDGTRSPYELNINYFDALSDAQSTEPMTRKIDRFVAAHAIMLAIIGVPGIYFHSLFGSLGWLQGAAQTGRNRTINRQKNQREKLEDELANPTSRRSQVFNRLADLLRIRSTQPAFHPQGEQHILDLGEQVFALERRSSADQGPVVCLHNVTGESISIVLNSAFLTSDSGKDWKDLIQNRRYPLKPGGIIQLEPYQVLWLAKD